MECEDTGSALLRFENGALGNIFVTTAGPSDLEGSITLIGEKAMVKIGGGCLNTIEEWYFATEDPEVDARFSNTDYHSQSVYGFGHKALYKSIAYSDLQIPQGVPEAGDAKKTLSLLLEIHQGSHEDVRPGLGSLS
jgi:predicted dehydrogenase